MPVSLATLAVYFIATSANLSVSLPATAVYILLGAVGVPVFSGFEGGFQKLVGMTGGYIIGYIPCVLVIGLLLKVCRKKIMLPVSCIAGTASALRLWNGLVFGPYRKGRYVCTRCVRCALPFGRCRKDSGRLWADAHHKTET